MPQFIGAFLFNRENSLGSIEKGKAQSKKVLGD